MENKAEDEITGRWRAAENAQHEAEIEETGQKRRRLGPTHDAGFTGDDSAHEEIMNILHGIGRPGRKGAKAAKSRW